MNEQKFNGATYEPEKDDQRLSGQLKNIYDLMKDGNWRTLQEISAITGAPQASVSAQLRHLRKERFGAHAVNKRSRGDRESGLYEYQLILRQKVILDYQQTSLNLIMR
jgi:Fic family protein